MPSASSCPLASLNALALNPKAAQASSRSPVAAAAGDIAGSMPYAVLKILLDCKVVFSPAVSKATLEAFGLSYPELARFSRVLHPKPEAEANPSINCLTNLPDVGFVLQELRYLAKSANLYLRAVRPCAKALALRQALPEGWQAWLADFAHGAGLLNPQTNPLFQLEDGELEQLASAFPAPEGTFANPPHFGPFMPIPSLGIAIQLAIDKKAFLANPDHSDFVRLNQMLKNDRAVCLAAVKQNGLVLRYVPDSLRTKEVSLAAVEQDGRALEYVPEALKTEDMCLAAVKEDGRALKYVPAALKTADMCLAAVKQDDWALRYVPEALKADICLAAKAER